jgi:hypothetical protein
VEPLAPVEHATKLILARWVLRDERFALDLLARIVPSQVRQEGDSRLAC